MSNIHRIIVHVETEALGSPQTIDVETDNRDRVAWDLARTRNKWPSAPEVPSLWATFLAWNALRRTGQPVGEFEQFNDHTTTADAEAVDVDPTQAATPVA